LAGELRQSEIITDVAHYEFSSDTQDVTRVVRPYVIVLSQDCDLLWDFREGEAAPAKRLVGVLLYELQPADNVDAKSDIWRRIRTNKDDRYQFIEGSPPSQDLAGEGLPELVVDFKRYFTVLPAELYRQIRQGGAGGARRRCRMTMPYREHLQCRAAHYMQRIGLPLDHESITPPGASPKCLPSSTNNPQMPPQAQPPGDRRKV